MRRPSAEHGFSLIEVMVAMTILLVGLGGGLKMLDVAAETSTTSRAREQATSVAREVVETARSIRFEQLGPSGTAGVIQAADEDLRDASPAAGWTVRRRGVTYAVSAGACTVDDPVDGIGTHDVSSWCSTGAGTATPASCRATLGVTGDISGSGTAAPDCGVDVNKDGTVDGLTGGCAADCAPTTPADATPADYKRVVVLVRWTKGNGTRWVLQSTTVPSTGASNAASVTGLTAQGLATAADGSVKLTNANATSLTFNASISSAPSGVRWTTDGVALPGGSGSGTAWTQTWNIGALGVGAPAPGQVLDGVHTVEVAALSAEGTAGQPRALTVVLDRNQPYAPQGFTATRQAGGVLTEWTASPEGDVIGYRVLRRASSGGPTSTVCALTTTTNCLDDTPLAATTDYWVVALDRDTNGVGRTGTISDVRSVRISNAPPPAPVIGTVTRGAQGSTVTWTSGGPDPDGDPIAFYRVFRDGQAPADAVGVTLNGSATSYVDTSAGNRSHKYWVTAVDDQGGQSAFSAQVSG